MDSDGGRPMTSATLLHRVDLDVTLDHSYFIIVGARADVEDVVGDGQMALLDQAYANGQGIAADGRAILMTADRDVDSQTTMRLEIFDRPPEPQLDAWDLAASAAASMTASAAIVAPLQTFRELGWPEQLVGTYTFRIYGKGFQNRPAPTTWLLQAWPHSGSDRLERLKALTLDPAAVSPHRAQAMALVDAASEDGLPQILRVLRDFH